MTVEELRRKIGRLKNEIEVCESETVACRNKIEMHENVLAKVQNSRNQFEEFIYARKSKIKSMQDKYPNMSFVKGYQEDLSSFLEGPEYQQTMQGYDQTEWNLRNSRESLACRENDLVYEIQEKENKLEYLQKKLRQMEREV